MNIFDLSIAVLVLLLVASCSSAPHESEFEGNWAGYIDMSSMAQEFQVDIPPGEDLPLFGLDLQKDKRFEFSSMARTYYGDWSVGSGKLILKITGFRDARMDSPYDESYMNAGVEMQLDLESDGTLRLRTMPEGETDVGEIVFRKS